MRWLLSAGVFVILFSCRKDSTELPGATGLPAWYPLTLKSTWYYRVDSIAFNGFTGKTDTTVFQLSETVDTLFLDNLGEQAARIRVMVRYDSFEPWTFRRMLYVKVNETYLERIESNRRFLKLSFPATEEAVWDMNARNDLPPALLFYNERFQPYKGKYIQADSCLMVSGRDIFNSLEEYQYREVYAKNIGLLFRRLTDKRKQAGMTNGYEITYTLTRYP